MFNFIKPSWFAQGVVCAALCATFFISPAQTTYGPNNPGTSGNNAGVGVNNWSNTNNSFTSNNTRASVATRGISRYLTATNYGFSIPLTETIEGISVEIERRAQSPTNPVAILNNWSTGLTKTISAGTDRCLIVIASTENGDGPTDVTALTYGGQSMTQIGEFTVGTAGAFNNRIEIWRLMETGIAAASGTAIVPTISAASFVENIEIYSSAVFQYVDQYNPIFDIESSTTTSDATSYQLATALSTLVGSMSVTAIACGQNTAPASTIGGTNTYTINSGFTEGTDIYFANPGFSTSGGCLQTATKASAAVGTEQPTFTFAGTPNRQVAVAFSLRGATGLDNSVRLIKGGTIVGSNYAKPSLSWPTGDTYETYGGPSDLWGTTWTPADINANNFGVALSGIVQGNSLQVDHIRITVYTAIILPIELLYFKGEVTNEGVVLEWSTASEKNNDYFTIERSGDGVNFEPILVKPGAGNSNVPIRYIANDNVILYQKTYYRLKQTDFDNTCTYSHIITLNTPDMFPDLVVFPNPATVSVSIRNFSDMQLTVRIVTTTGVLQMEKIVSNGKQDIDVSAIPTGLYVVQMIRGNASSSQKLWIVR